MTERRTFQASAIALTGDGKTFSGVAAPFMSRTYIGQAKRGFFEQIAPQAFDRILSDKSDVVALFNHNADYLLGRRANGTLRLTKTKTGLHSEIDLPDTTAGRDVAESTRRGDIPGQSFSFEVLPGGEDWGSMPGGHGQLRTLRDISSVVDVGPVSLPCYKDSTAAMRSADAVLDEHARQTGLASVVDDIAAGRSCTRSAVSWASRGNILESVRLLTAAARCFGGASNSLDAYDGEVLRALHRDGTGVRFAFQAVLAAQADPEGGAMSLVSAAADRAALSFGVSD